MSFAEAVATFHRHADYSQPENQCWLWRGHIQTNGYGAILAGERYLVHRLSFELNRGPIAEGLEVMHLCNERTCYNWRHLILGTHKQNMAHTRIGEQPRTLTSDARQCLANERLRQKHLHARKSTETPTLPQGHEKPSP